MDDITDDFRLSFLAGTRNLMLDLHCALAGIRSLVLARDDGVVGTCGI